MTCYNHMADEQAKATRKARKHRARRYFLLTLAGACFFYLLGCKTSYQPRHNPKPGAYGMMDKVSANPSTTR